MKFSTKINLFLIFWKSKPSELLLFSHPNELFLPSFPINKTLTRTFGCLMNKSLQFYLEISTNFLYNVRMLNSRMHSFILLHSFNMPNTYMLVKDKLSTVRILFAVFIIMLFGNKAD